MTERLSDISKSWGEIYFKMYKHKNNWFKVTIALFLCFLVRIIPFRAPNIEPILTTTMPFAKAYGALTGFFFAFTSIIAYDLATGTLGKWTFITSVSYGLVGLASAFYFKHHKASAINFAVFAVMGTLFFDATTGLLTGPLFFHQTFYIALVGQIPFTLLHLVGNVAFAFLLSPLIYKYAVYDRKSRRLEPVPIISMFHPKKVLN